MSIRNPEQRIRPNNGTLTFNIYESGTVAINYTNEPINERELYADALRGASKVASVVSTIVEGGGYTTSVVPGGQSVGVPLIGIGKGISLVGDGADIGVKASLSS